MRFEDINRVVLCGKYRFERHLECQQTTWLIPEKTHAFVVASPHFALMQTPSLILVGGPTPMEIDVACTQRPLSEAKIQ